MKTDLHLSIKILLSFAAEFRLQFRTENNDVNKEVKLENDLFPYNVKASSPNN